MSPRTPGTYALILRVHSSTEILIGRSRCLPLTAGLYAYVGSARGPGGLRARLGRHASIAARKHWHIDYLLPHAELAGALMVESAHRLECRWSAVVSQLANDCVDGFGASDCRCRGHLFKLGPLPREKRLIQQAKKLLGADYLTRAELESPRSQPDVPAKTSS